ncbi:tRNA 2'-phosphotransferase, putative [Entamoeba invadens IP1]|uniref:2'-phosphotransferase n=1 Tax=Entamoeba invadens IP1 TaxID=370355 RepID=A0A0A1UAN8_ENTIV|nr:tRNA 2'-phosphotransferase, putative [Entamoeba invadens IP1]ELP92035.1 tRNA 2'-phosphotransferase, putative [Entamoeba invadens IP1]|eukprot:XP_004258806.1 tRNA 2'-phosphotransferase, putative [Entamoeba invadens IP1]
MSNSRADIEVSKTISYLLRHGAQKEHLPMDESGWVKMTDLLSNRQMSGISQETICRIVATNSKQRFTIEGDGQDMKIRANQGHSIDVKVDMKKIETPEDYPIVIHGTYLKNISEILKKGLLKMGRLHVHMAKALPQHIGKQMSGMRSNCQLVIYVDIKKAMGDGLVFYESSNGVVLCEGPIDKKYFQKIVKYPSLENYQFN